MTPQELEATRRVLRNNKDEYLETLKQCEEEFNRNGGFFR